MVQGQAALCRPGVRLTYAPCLAYPSSFRLWVHLHPHQLPLAKTTSISQSIVRGEVKVGIVDQWESLDHRIE